MITHYGLFWSERDVSWRKPGELLGREKPLLGRRGAPTKTERDTSRDYQDFVGLYALYGEGELLYVGEAGLGNKGSLFARLKQHRSDSLTGRWDRFSWFGREDSAGKTSNVLAIAQLEAIAIALSNPGFNKQSGTFGGAIQVFQVSHANADGDIDTKLERIRGQLDKLAECDFVQLEKLLKRSLGGSSSKKHPAAAESKRNKKRSPPRKTAKRKS